MADHLLGWTSPQWDEALAYYNLCHKDATIKLLPFYIMALGLLPPFAQCINVRLDCHLKVMEFWEHQRLDQPGGSKIIMPDGQYRTRKK